MREFFDKLVQQIGEMEPAGAYAALALSAFLENVVPPVPGDTVVVFSAYLVGRGALSLWPAYGATCFGGFLGFMVMYYLGLRHGRSFFASRGGRFFSPEVLERAEGWLARYGMGLVLVNRFLSGIRSAIALAAGIGGMDWRKVALCSLISMALWNALLFYAGLLVGQNWEEVTQLLQNYNRVMAVAFLVVFLPLAWRRWRRRTLDSGKDRS